jgi:transcriptional regulator with GAF, ATPase, and Fis domain
MNAERSIRIAAAFAKASARSPTAEGCRVCVDMLRVTGAAITIMGTDQANPVFVSSPAVAALEDVQFTAGQGPCRDAFSSGLPVRAPSFDVETSTKWPSFVALARTVEIGAVFAYPLTVGAAKIGALTLYQRDEGHLSAEQHHDTLAIAAVVAEAVLSMQDRSAPGTLSPEMDEAFTYRAEIYQASGMVAVQLSIRVEEALLRIRGHAFAHNLPIVEVAAGIVARRLRLADDSARPGHGPNEQKGGAEHGD